MTVDAVQPDRLPRRVAVVGAGGHVGRRLASALEESGVEVRAVRRGDDVADLVAGADAVAHVAGTLQPRGGNSYRSANVDTTRRTVAAALAASVPRVVLLSYVGAHAGSPNEYLRTKGEAEAIVRDAPLDGVILRATFVFGSPEDPGPSMAPLLARGGRAVAVIGSGRQRYRPVFVGDVVRALAGALQPGFPAGTYALAGPDTLSVDELVTRLNRRVVKERHLDGRLAHVAAAISPSLTRAMIGVLAADSLPDRPLAWEPLGIEPHSLDAVWSERAAA